MDTARTFNFRVSDTEIKSWEQFYFWKEVDFMTQLPHYAQKYRIKGNRLYETVAGKNGVNATLILDHSDTEKVYH